MKSRVQEELVHLPENRCKNCGLETSGLYCPRCGQKHLSGRFSLKQSFKDIFHQVFNLERGLIYTFQQLLLYPGQVITNYLSKATVRYMHPFRFVFILATISALLTILSGTFELPEITGMVETSDPEKVKKIEQVHAFMEVFKKYLTFILLAIIPINALITRIIYYKKKLNYAEHLILNSYTYGFTIVLTLPLLPVIYLPGGIYMNGLLNTVVYYAGFAWVFSEFFKESFIKSFLKMILLTVMVILFSSVLFFLIVIIYSKLF